MQASFLQEFNKSKNLLQEFGKMNLYLMKPVDPFIRIEGTAAAEAEDESLWMN